MPENSNHVGSSIRWSLDIPTLTKRILTSTARLGVNRQEDFHGLA